MAGKMRIRLSVAALLGVAALVLCIVMGIHSLSGTALVGCGTGSSCDSVLGGRWSTLFGIFPIGGIAAGVYLAFLLAACVVLFSKDDALRDLASKALLLLSGAIIGAAVWFIGLQAFVEREFCKYCMSAHFIGIVCSLLAASSLLRKTPSGRSWMAAGAGLAALLAVLQVLTAPDSVYQEGRGEEAFPIISPDEAPVVGDPGAEYVIDLLYDYQCSHCRTVHDLLPDVISHFDGRVAFVLCPCPLSPKCNPYVPREETRFEGSCDLARLALAVYELDPGAFAGFDAWLFGAGEAAWRPRAVESARERAGSIVGKESLDALLPDPSLSEPLRRAADLFGRTSTRGNAGIPRFVFGDQWVVPAADTAEDLAKILSEQFGIR